MTTATLTRWAIALTATGFTILWSGQASAKTQIAGDFDWLGSDEAPGGWENGVGGGLRLGYELDLVALSLIPEIGGTYHSFPDLDAQLYRGIVGGRLRFLKILEPGIYAHFGVGRFESDRLLVPSWTAGTADGGVSLDLTVLPVLEVGAHAGYNVQFGKDEIESFSYWSAGLNAALVF
jgi:hypothetical protein